MKRRCDEGLSNYDSHRFWLNHFGAYLPCLCGGTTPYDGARIPSPYLGRCRSVFVGVPLA